MKKFETDFHKLVIAKFRYHKQLLSTTKSLKPYIKFDFFISHQESDGFVIVHETNLSNAPYNAPLYKCIDIINEKGELTETDYFSITI